MKKYRLPPLIALAFVFTTFLGACESDDYHSPAQRLDLADFISDENGVASQMVLDNGDTLILSKPAKGFQSDTICRCLAVFRPAADGSSDIVNVTSLGQILTLPPLRYSTVYVDSTDVVSVWRGGDYLNLRLSLRTKDSAHSFGFALLGTTTARDGAATLHLALYNNGAGDTPYFSRTVYLSCALRSVMGVMQSGRDSVSIMINEYNKGFVAYKLPL